MTKQVIGFHYTLKDETGNLIDSSNGRAPLLFLEGSGMIIPGLENAISKLNIGDKKNVKVVASEAYGEVVQDLVLTVKRTQFPEDADLKVGDQFQVNDEPHAPVFTVKTVGLEDIVIDGNHPLAGVDLFFDIEITDKRAATEEEMAHGHAHGPGGHHHH